MSVWLLFEPYNIRRFTRDNGKIRSLFWEGGGNNVEYIYRIISQMTQTKGVRYPTSVDRFYIHLTVFIFGSCIFYYVLPKEYRIYTALSVLLLFLLIVLYVGIWKKNMSLHEILYEHRCVGDKKYYPGTHDLLRSCIGMTDKDIAEGRDTLAHTLYMLVIELGLIMMLCFIYIRFFRRKQN